MPTPPMRRARFEQDLDTLIRARYPLIWLVSWEEQRVEGMLASLAEKHGKALWDWTVTRGLRRAKSGGRAAPPASEQTDEPLEALRAIGRIPEPSIVVLKDFQPYLEDPRVVRAVRDLGQQL
ncbi:MAG: ATPase, partial [Myxococcaceae bacterium]